MPHEPDALSLEEARAKVEQAHAAWLEYRNFTQEQADAIVEAVAAAGRAEARRLAQMAGDETGMGNVEDKTAKNLLATDILPRSMRGMRLLGVLRELPGERITEIGVPVGVVAAVCPTTNPTSTAFFKILISLKAGNAVVISPHPRAKECTCAAAGIAMEAAEKAGAPRGLIQCLERPTLEATQELMKHPKTALILATGGTGMVRAAYSSGKPAYGVGPGNVPIWLDPSADVAEAVRLVVEGKKFDYGTVCSSEQTLVAERRMREAVLEALKRNGAYLMNDAERAAVEKTLFSGGTRVRGECVGKPPEKIAEMAGFSVPPGTTILAGEIPGIGKEFPLSAEKLSPVLALFWVEDFEAGVQACESILRFGGIGHTAVIHARDEARVSEFARRVSAFRVLVNTSSPQGSVGITTNLQPSMTLGCGAIGGNVTSDNVGPQHLINIRRVAWAVRRPEEAMGSADSGLKALDRAALAAAVAKYLEQRGVAVRPAGVQEAIRAAMPASAPAAAPPSPGGISADALEAAVDRYLARHGAAPACPCGQATGKPAAPAPQSPPAAEKPPEPPAPKIEIADFVCEADVREAIAKKKKIFIGKKTIVTPAARDAAAADEVLVMAER
ncbi:MAG: aldehyde dehydrogenase family protein [Bryobacteraceae bacterium]|nr:aldehyde dehydrogenase family protein [Bryobacteraceae bacterium]